jgi:GTP-binding protein EngB required for normal cell division
MKHHILDQQLQPYRIRLTELVRQQHEMSQATKNESLTQTLSELRDTLNEPFLFVIVGEVKAGKSSFINALLATGEEVVKVAPDPCTDTIQQVTYAETAETITVNPLLKKIMLPVEILKDISIVDTPGTNTILEHHQEITERFIPRSDLVVFIFEAKNPYRQSAWEFFDYIHTDWQKKIIFVLQQADLMEPADLKVNLKGVRDYARKKGMEEPVVFAVSAKYEQQGRQAESGFADLNAYIREQITGLSAFRLKLLSSISTARNVNTKLYGDLSRMETHIKADRDFRASIIDTLRDQEERSARQIDKLILQLLEVYDHSTQRAQRELSQGLGFFPLTKKSFLSIFGKENSPQVWLKGLTQQLELELDRNFNRRLNEGVEEIAESISQMARIVDLKIKNSQSVLGGAEEVFGDIADRRRAVLRDLHDGFAEFMNRTESFVGEEIFPEASRFSPNIAAGGGIAVIGAVLTAVTHVTALDITGGILSAAGLLFAGGTVVFKRGKILGGFAREIQQGRDNLQETLDLKLKAYVTHIRKRIDQNFAEFDALLESEQQHLQRLAGQHQAIDGQLNELEQRLKAEK